MNTLFKNVILVLIVASLAACSATTEELVLKSPEGNIEVSFKAHKANSLEPFDVIITIKGYEKDRSLTMDMYNSKFNNETVLIDWKDENKFIITLKQSDGDDRVMDVYFSPEEIRLQERGGEDLKMGNPLMNL